MSEDGGEQTVTVTATLNAGARTADTVVQVTVEAGTALAADYTATSVTLTIPADQAGATGTLTVTPVDDAIAEGDETLTVSGTSPLPVTPATLILGDDDSESTSIALALQPDEVSEDGGEQTVTVTATR